MGTPITRPLRFVFQFPPIHGAFDAGDGIVYVFGGLHESEIENIIVHETLHYVLLRVAGTRASLKLDNIYTIFDSWERKKHGYSLRKLLSSVIPSLKSSSNSKTHQVVYA